jgi:hypothetical protein
MSHDLFAVLFDDNSSGRVQKKKFRAVIMICSIVHRIRGTDSGLAIHRSARESSKNRQQTSSTSIGVQGQSCQVRFGLAWATLIATMARNQIS